MPSASRRSRTPNLRRLLVRKVTLTARVAALGLLGFLGILQIFTPSGLDATECCSSDSPFREGEGWADKAATCDNIGYWADRAPTTNARISLVVEGKLSAVKWTGTLAYLVMCDAPGVQLLCVTYSTNGMRAGDVVTFGGGYERRGARRIVLDPCLASRE
jgi:hypothetical protein